TEWSVLARHTLCHHAQRGLCGSKLCEARLSAQASRGSRKDHGSAAERHEPSRRLAPDQESRKTTDAPEILELRGGQLAKIHLSIVAGVEHDEISGLQPVARSHCTVEQGSDIGFFGGIGWHRGGTAAFGGDRPRNLR